MTDDDIQEIAAAANCPHQDAVFWNPYNHCVQCHRCGLIFAPLARFVKEYERAAAEMTPDPIRVTSVNEATYQITIRQTAANLMQAINILRWVLGDVDIPDAPTAE